MHMTDDHHYLDHSQPLPSELEALHRRLVDDGAAWRAGLPSSTKTERYFQALMRQEQRTPFAAERIERGSRVRHARTTQGDSSMFQVRIKTVTAAVALAAVVVLFAVLFYSFAGRGTQSAAGRSVGQPSVTKSPSGQQKYSQYVPLVAPSDPHMIYKLVPAGGSSGDLLLARSPDGGTTWKTFALPAGKSTDYVSPVAFVSPLNPGDVFLTVTVTLPLAQPGYQSCPSSQASSSGLTSQKSSNGLSSYAALSGGPSLCAVEYLSTDGGVHWGPAHVPASAAPAALGDTSGYSFFPADLWSTGSTVFHVQGTRLYSTTNVAPGVPPNSPEAQSTQTIRIVVSTDGGLNWTYVDGGLVAASGQSICDYAAAPSGSTLFALTAAGCSSDGPAASPPVLWRSDDAGGQWVKVGQLPGSVENGMIAVSGENGQAPLLYINMAQETCTSHTCGIDASPSNLQVSADGGQTWTPAPTKGFPTSLSGNPLQNPGEPLGALSDGSILFLAPPVPGSASLYAWKLGDASWHQVGSSFDTIDTAFVVPGMANTICVVTGVAPVYQLQTFHS
jgi:hypothetical protein